jgi:hypothetical protein
MIVGHFEKTDFKVYVTYYFKKNGFEYARIIGYFDFKNNWQKVSTNKEFKSIFNDVTLDSLNIEDLNHFTPPTPIGYKILIPEYWEALFPDDKFIIGGFEAQLERKNNSLVVDVAYLQWTSFREELLKPENATLARQMGAVMRYLEQQALNQDFV